MRESFINAQRLLRGPWQAFERDVTRLLLVNGFTDVRALAGEGGRGADVLGVKNNETWVIHCSFVDRGFPRASTVDGVAEAARFHQATRIYVASSRPAAAAVNVAIERWRALGVNVEVLDPATILAMALHSPEYSSSHRVLRPYQRVAVELFVAALRETGRGQVVLATGLGKTVVMAETVAQLFRDGALTNGRVLVLAGTRELVEQLQRAFWDQLPKWVSTHCMMAGEEPSYWEGVTFATVQSAVSKLDMLPHFDLLLVDEAHHLGSHTLMRLVSQMTESMIGGVTATPWRGDGYDIDKLLGVPVVRVGIAEGLSQGYLCEADYRLLADDIDWDVIREQSKNNYSISQLNRLLLMPVRDEEAARAIRSVFDSEKRRALVVFCSTILHAQTFAGVLRLFGLRVEAITGDMSARERDRVLVAFQRGWLDAVTTRDLFNEGVDVPDVDMIAFMRVTHSRRIFVQQLGRGLRISPGKRKVVVLDFVSDLRRIAEVLELDSADKAGVEHLLGSSLIQFRDVNAGAFMLQWMKQQADLFTREGDATLEVPDFLSAGDPRSPQ